MKIRSRIFRNVVTQRNKHANKQTDKPIRNENITFAGRQGYNDINGVQLLIHSLTSIAV